MKKKKIEKGHEGVFFFYIEVLRWSRFDVMSDMLNTLLRGDVGEYFVVTDKGGGEDGDSTIEDD